MKNYILSIFSNKGFDKKVVRKINPSLFNYAYQNRFKEISSLKEYDQGKKKIHAPDLQNIM